MGIEKHRLKRDRRIMTTLVVVAGCCVGLLVWRLAFAEIPVALPTRHTQVAPGKPVEIVFGGDTMIADASVAALGHGHGDKLMSGVKNVFSGADEVVVNAEAPITANATGGARGAKYTYNVLPSDADALARAGVTVLNLGNNHSMDRGAPGLADTRAWASSKGMSTVGAGPRRSVAEQPLIFDTPQGKVALVSFGENFGQASRSTLTTAGIVPFSADKVIRGMTLAKRGGAALVIAFVHWGDNYGPVNVQQEFWAKQLADAGYDLVIGSGSHTLQGVARVDGVPIVYGLGNLVFGSNGRYDVYGTVGLAATARLTWRPRGKTTLTFTCLQADNQLTSFVTRVCNRAETKVAATILGPEVTWKARTGVLTL